MVTTPVYMDNHATTRVDPRVVDAMLPYFSERFGNAGSTSHVFGWDAREAVAESRLLIAQALGSTPREIIFTSGATESNNLALRGVAEARRRRGNHIVTVATEHKSIVDPLRRLARRGVEVTWLPVIAAGHREAGRIELDQLDDAIRDDSILVSVMLANNEIGVLQDIAAVGRLCKERGVLFHCDATQGVGKIPINVETLQVDLMSFSGHKIYGPKGIGGLYVRRRAPHVRLEPQIDGGGQEHGLRSGTLNVPGIVGMAKALGLCLEELDEETERLRQLRNRLYEGLTTEISDVTLNGPTLDDPSLRLAGNLNCSFAGVDGEALMMSMGELAVSSGSACTSANPEPSHVLRALGLSDELTRASLRFGLGRFNTVEEVDFAVACVRDAVARLRRMNSPV